MFRIVIGSDGQEAVGTGGKYGSFFWGTCVPMSHTVSKWLREGGGQRKRKWEGTLGRGSICLSFNPSGHGCVVRAG